MISYCRKSRRKALKIETISTEEMKIEFSLPSPSHPNSDNSTRINSFMADAEEVVVVLIVWTAYDNIAILINFIYMPAIVCWNGVVNIWGRNISVYACLFRFLLVIGKLRHTCYLFDGQLNICVFICYCFALPVVMNLIYF